MGKHAIGGMRFRNDEAIEAWKLTLFQEDSHVSHDYAYEERRDREPFGD